MSDEVLIAVEAVLPGVGNLIRLRIHPPEGWVSDDAREAKHFYTVVDAQGAWCISLFGMLLGDGSNLFFLAFDGGTRFARTCADTGWAIEERFAGSPPAKQHRRMIDVQWRQVLDDLVEAKGRAERDEAA